MARWASSLTYWLALTGSAIVAVAPFLSVPLDDIGDAQLVLVPILVGILAYVAYRRSAAPRLKILRGTLAAAGLSVGASIILRLLPSYPIVDMPIPGVVAPVFGLDGGSAYDADLYEVWCEIWIALAAVFICLRYLVHWTRWFHLGPAHFD
jgi:hypothetical protein